VKFADGVRPGEGTSPSAGEDLPSPPPPSKLPKEKRFKKKKKKKIKAGLRFLMELYWFVDVALTLFAFAGPNCSKLTHGRL